jgi:hypothetical protein
MFYDRNSRNHAGWDAMVWGAKEAAADPALAEPYTEAEIERSQSLIAAVLGIVEDDEPDCPTCANQRELTTDGPLGHVMRKPCWDCRGDW